MLNVVYLNTSIQGVYVMYSLCRHTSSGKRDILLSNTVQNVGKVNNGLCPHGMSPGACPVCSGMGGGGRVGERPQKAGEMSYHQCAMIGAMMKARALRMEAHENNIKKHAEYIANFENNLLTLAAKMSEFALKISNSFLLKPIAVTINNVIVPILNGVKNIINTVTNFVNTLVQIKNKIIDIQDKLNAVFGEAKAFLDRKVSEFVSNIKTKFKNLFKIFKSDNNKDDETKADEDKKIFNLKKFIHWIRDKKKNDRESNSRS